MTADVHHHKHHHDPQWLYTLMTRLCRVARRYPTTLFWVVLMAALIAITAGTASTLVGILGIQLFILGLLMHEVAMNRERNRRE